MSLILISGVKLMVNSYNTSGLKLELITLCVSVNSVMQFRDYLPVLCCTCIMRILNSRQSSPPRVL